MHQLVAPLSIKIESWSKIYDIEKWFKDLEECDSMREEDIMPLIGKNLRINLWPEDAQRQQGKRRQHDDQRMVDGWFIRTHLKLGQ